VPPTSSRTPDDAPLAGCGKKGALATLRLCSADGDDWFIYLASLCQRADFFRSLFRALQLRFSQPGSFWTRAGICGTIAT
jgi:hypothetical protein